MFSKPLLTILLVLTVASLACGINFDFPKDIKTGPMETEEINVPIPDVGGPVGLNISFGAGELDIKGGETSSLVTGTASYNVTDFKPEITTEGDDVYIEQGDLNVSGVPNFDENIKNEWDLTLANTPLDLYIKAGAYKANYDLGGLSLNRLEIADGAADVNLSFSDPNQIELVSFDYSTGASSVTMEDLANANISTMTFRSGAGSYKLAFTGELQQDMEVLIESGISSIEIVIPEDVTAEVRFDGGLSDVNTFGIWESQGSYYYQTGDGFEIKIRVKMGAGSLELRNR